MPASTAAFLANRQVLFDWLLADTAHPLFDIVDAAKLQQLASADIGDGRLQQCFWQIIQTRAVLDLDTFTGLTPWANDRTPIGLPALADAAAAPLVRTA